MTHAAAVAYYGLLSLFPFFLLLFSILGSLTSSEARRAAVVSFLLRYFPTKFDFLSGQMDALQQMRIRMGVGGAVALIWAAHGVFSAVSSAVNNAWGVEKPRSFWHHKLFSFLMLVAAGIGLLLLLLLGSVFQIVHSTWFADATWRTPGIAVLGTFFLDYGTTILLTVGIGLIFYFVPNTKVRFRDVWPGAILTGPAVAARARRVLVLPARHEPVQPRARVDCRGRRVPRLGLHVVGHPAVRRGIHRRLRAAAARAA